MALSKPSGQARLAQIRVFAREVLALEVAHGRTQADQLIAQLWPRLSVVEQDVLCTCLQLTREARARRRDAELEVEELLQTVGAAAELLGLPEGTTVATALELLGFDIEHDLARVTPASVLVRAVWRARR